MSTELFGLACLVIAWVMFVLIPATDNRAFQVVRIGYTRAQAGQEVQADAANRAH